MSRSDDIRKAMVERYRILQPVRSAIKGQTDTLTRALAAADARAEAEDEQLRAAEHPPITAPSPRASDQENDEDRP